MNNDFTNELSVNIQRMLQIFTAQEPMCYKYDINRCHLKKVHQIIILVGQKTRVYIITVV